MNCVPYLQIQSHPPQNLHLQPLHPAVSAILHQTASFQPSIGSGTLRTYPITPHAQVGMHLASVTGGGLVSPLNQLNLQATPPPSAPVTQTTSTQVPPALPEPNTAPPPPVTDEEAQSTNLLDDWIPTPANGWDYKQPGKKRYALTVKQLIAALRARHVPDCSRWSAEQCVAKLKQLPSDEDFLQHHTTQEEKASSRWLPHNTARFAGILTTAGLSISDATAKRLGKHAQNQTHLALGDRRFSNACWLLILEARDNKKSRQDLDNKHDPHVYFFEIFADLFNDLEGVVVTHVAPTHPKLSHLDPSQANVPQPMSKLQNRFQILKKQWDLAYCTNYKVSGSLQPDFWQYCHGDAGLFYLFKCMMMANNANTG